MRTLPSRWRQAGLALIVPALLVAGCSSSNSTSAEVTVTGLSVSPRPASVTVGETTNLTARATYSDGSTANVTADAAWVSSTTSVATVSAGVVTGVAPGTSRVTATYQGKSAYSDVTVNAVPPTLLSLAITPDPASVSSGATIQLTVTGTFDSGPPQDLTAEATFVSSVEAVATVSAAGVVTGHSAGAATITASARSMSARREVTVNEVVPPAPEQIVFWNGYGSGVSFVAFGGPNLSSVAIDSTERFQGRTAIRFDVTNVSTSYSGGSWVTSTPRDLSAYDALTFYAKASAAATLPVSGFGDLAGVAGTSFATERRSLPVSTSWQKFTIPVPDPAKFTGAAALFHLADGVNKGLTLYVADVVYEHLGAGVLGTPAAAIDVAGATTVNVNEGQRATLNPESNRVVYSSVTGDPANPITLLPVANRFFTFTSADPTVATVDADGVVTGVAPGGPVAVTATLASASATGAYAVVVGSALARPATLPPAPAQSAGATVYSLWSSVDPGGLNSTTSDHSGSIMTWHTDWSTGAGGDPYAITSSAGTAGPRKFVFGADQHVGVNFENTTIDAAGLGLNTLHVDVWTPNASSFEIKLVDFGANGVWNGPGSDDVEDTVTLTATSHPALSAEGWISYDLPLSRFVGLTTTGHLAQIVLKSASGGTVYLDNLYLYAGTPPVLPTPETLPPAPAQSAGAGVYSLWSSVDPGGLNSTTSDHSGSIEAWRTDWSTGIGGDPFSITSSAGTASPRKWVFGAGGYIGINFEHTTIDAAGSGLNTLHVDLWTPDAAAFEIKVVDFGADGVAGGTDNVEGITTLSSTSTPHLTTGTWLSYDLPLSGFPNLTTTGHIAQLVLKVPTGGGTVYLDNLYLYAAAPPPSAPTTAPPAPTAAAANVRSLLSSTYTGGEANGDYSARVDDYDALCFGGAGSVADATAGTDAVKHYTLPQDNFAVLDLVGAFPTCGATQTLAHVLDASGMTRFHVDVWSPGGTSNFQVHLINVTGDSIPGAGQLTSPASQQYNTGALTVPAGVWTSFDLSLSADFTPGAAGALDKLGLVKLFVGTTGEYYVDNLYFYTP